jgi:hypothetical protein
VPSSRKEPKKMMEARDWVYAGTITSGKLAVVRQMNSCHAVSPIDEK